MVELLARIEAATDFDRELDRAIGFAIDGWKVAEITRTTGVVSPMIDIRGDLYPDHPGSMYPALTESIDEALAVVERVLGRHWLWEIKRGFGFRCILWMLETDSDDRPVPTGHSSASAPLAILAALLKALTNP